MNPREAGVRALFLDRDGTLMVDTGYVRDPADVVLLPGVARGLREAHQLGFELIVVSNQSGVGRGIITRAQLDAVQARFEKLLGGDGVVIDAVRFCLHTPDEGCLCRKPRPGLLQDAASARGIDLQRSIMIGDRDSDMVAGRSAGCTTIIVGGTSVNADHAVDSFESVLPILQRLTD